MATLFIQPATNLPPTTSTPPTVIPPLVYRVHRASAQTRYSFATGFSAKNQTTILNYTSALSRFGLAHLYQQTNISSPFISVYDSLSHAESIAKHWADTFGEEVWIVTVDTRHFARGPVFRAADLLKESGAKGDERVHWGEYLVMYRIPAQAIRDQTPVGRGKAQAWRAVGVIGGAYGWFTKYGYVFETYLETGWVRLVHEATIDMHWSGSWASACVFSLFFLVSTF